MVMNVVSASISASRSWCAFSISAWVYGSIMVFFSLVKSSVVLFLIRSES